MEMFLLDREHKNRSIIKSHKRWNGDKSYTHKTREEKREQKANFLNGLNTKKIYIE